MTNPFDGAGVIAAISLAVAFSAYLRTIAMKRLRGFIREVFDPKKARPLTDVDHLWIPPGEFLRKRKEQKKRFYENQEEKCKVLRFYAYVQIGLGLVICALTIRLTISVFAVVEFAGLVEFTLFDQNLASLIDVGIATVMVTLGVVYLGVHLKVDGNEIGETGTRLKDIRASIRNLS